MFQRAAVIGFSGIALVACSSGSTTAGGIDAPATTDTACETNSYGECYPTADLGTQASAFTASSGVRRTAGSTMRNYKWFGFKPGAIDRGVTNPDDNLKPVALADYYDPKGTLGYKVIHLVASSRWCSVCAEETKNYLTKNAASDKAKGLVVIQTMIDGLRQGVPATSKDIDSWSASNGIFVADTDGSGTALKTGSLLFALALDPDNKNLGPFFDGAGVPWNGYVDARTMEIIDYAVGFNPGGDDAALKFVAANAPKGQ
jgi:hypothetical protein